MKPEALHTAFKRAPVTTDYGPALRAALLAEYNFDNVLTDSSGNGKHLSGSASYGTAKLGAAGWSGDGSSKMVTLGSALITSGNFWISAWASWTDSAALHGLVSQADDGAGASGCFAIDNDYFTNKRPRFILYNTLSAPSVVTWGSDINDGNYHFINAWFDGTNLNLKVDNGTTITTPMVGSVRYDSTQFRIGLAFLVYYWQGLVDAVHIFNRAPAAGELDYLWNGGSGRQLN